MKLFSNFKRKEVPEKAEDRLETLMTSNTNGGKRSKILEELVERKLFIGTRTKMPLIVDSSTPLDYLTTTSPEGVDGYSLIAFLSEQGLNRRNKEAYPALIDFSVINSILESSDLTGLVIISSSAWVYFPKDELKS